MADNRTMAQLLQAPTEGYEDAIVIPEINANFELKHGLINLVQNKQFFGHDKEDPHAHIRYFNKITSTMRFPDIPSTSIKLMLFPFSLEVVAIKMMNSMSMLVKDTRSQDGIDDKDNDEGQKHDVPKHDSTSKCNLITKNCKRLVPLASFKVLETKFNNVHQLTDLLMMNILLMTTQSTFYNTLNLIFQNSVRRCGFMEYVKKSIDERALHKMEYDSMVNERQTQTTEEKVDSSKALDASSIIIESNGTESQKQEIR
ncbi:hypothetical protein Tco_0703533 [Tanacetum coccineum]|uniref:Reverse transcriptase domain-containing protein n=1 Tax=Tanacetum coccineum TaxID=301880 RepID=A0ABQ4Y0Z9_9ASTR